MIRHHTDPLKPVYYGGKTPSQRRNCFAASPTQFCGRDPGKSVYDQGGVRKVNGTPLRRVTVRHLQVPVPHSGKRESLEAPPSFLGLDTGSRTVYLSY